MDPDDLIDMDMVQDDTVFGRNPFFGEAQRSSASQLVFKKPQILPLRWPRASRGSKVGRWSRTSSSSDRSGMKARTAAHGSRAAAVRRAQGTARV